MAQGGEKERRGHTSQVTSDMITLDAFDATPFPSASETQVVSRFTSNVDVAQMVIELIGGRGDMVASFPFTLDRVFRRGVWVHGHGGGGDGDGVVGLGFRGDRLDGGGRGAAGIWGARVGILIRGDRVEEGCRWQRRVCHLDLVMGVEKKRGGWLLWMMVWKWERREGRVSCGRKVLRKGESGCLVACDCCRCSRVEVLVELV